MSRICIDPGHGGAKPGAVVDPPGPAGPYEEEDIALAVSLQLAAFLEARGHAVLLTRDDDRDIGFTARAVLANQWKADAFISIHGNAASSPAANGAWCLFAKGSIRGRALAGAIFDQLAKVPGAVDADPEAEVYPDVKPWTNYVNGVTVLRATGMPAVLVETGFLTNAGDLADLTTPEKAGLIAAAIGLGAEAWLVSEGKRLPLPDVPAPPPPHMEDTMRGVRDYIVPSMTPVAVLDQPVRAVALQFDGPDRTTTVRELVIAVLVWLRDNPDVLKMLGTAQHVVRWAIGQLLKVLDPAT